jgi:hypothetical protein
MYNSSSTDPGIEKLVDDLRDARRLYKLSSNNLKKVLADNSQLRAELARLRNAA